MSEKECQQPEPQTTEERLNRVLHRCGHYLHHHDTHPRQAAVLSLLRERGTMSQREVQEALGIRPGSASELISKLEDRGMLTRIRGESDKRRIMLSLSQKGLMVDLKPTDELLSERYAVLSEDERETLVRILEKLVDSWSVGGNAK